MKRISKQAARKMWENNQDFIVVPCKCSPTGLGRCIQDVTLIRGIMNVVLLINSSMNLLFTTVTVKQVNTPRIMWRIESSHTF